MEASFAVKPHVAELRAIWPGFWTEPTFGFSDGDSVELITASTAPAGSTALACEKSFEKLAAGSWLVRTQQSRARPLSGSGGESAGIVVSIQPTISASLDLAAHESFHMYQFAGFSGIFDAPLQRTITLASFHRFEFALNLRKELLELADAVESVDADRRSASVARYLSLRTRRLRDHAGIADSERRMERVEGTAEFVGHAAASVLHEPPASMATRRSQLAQRLRHLASGVSSDTMMILDLRPRTYFTGAGVAAILEELRPTWQREVELGAALDSLLAIAVR